jgi:hypothetical protein
MKPARPQVLGSLQLVPVTLLKRVRPVLFQK